MLSIHRWILFLIYSLVGSHTAFCLRDFVNQSRLRIIIKNARSQSPRCVVLPTHPAVLAGWGLWRMKGFTPSRNRFFSSSGPGIRLGVLYWCCVSGQSMREEEQEHCTNAFMGSAWRRSEDLCFTQVALASVTAWEAGKCSGVVCLVKMKNYRLTVSTQSLLWVKI